MNKERLKEMWRQFSQNFRFCWEEFKYAQPGGAILRQADMREKEQKNLKEGYRNE